MDLPLYCVWYEKLPIGLGDKGKTSSTNQIRDVWFWHDAWFLLWQLRHRIYFVWFVGWSTKSVRSAEKWVYLLHIASYSLFESGRTFSIKKKIKHFYVYIEKLKPFKYITKNGHTYTKIQYCYPRPKITVVCLIITDVIQKCFHKIWYRQIITRNILNFLTLDIQCFEWGNSLEAAYIINPMSEFAAFSADSAVDHTKRYKEFKEKHSDDKKSSVEHIRKHVFKDNARFVLFSANPQYIL